ncbi:hypothetical protein PYCC9005_003046 [Savitreella phatthalungensis]
MSQLGKGTYLDSVELKITPVRRESYVRKGDAQTRGVPWTPMLVLAWCTFAASQFGYGYDDKVISPIAAIPQFVERYQGRDRATGELVLSARHQNLVFSLPLVGAIIGAIMTTPLNKKFGRRIPLAASYIFSLGGGFLQLFAPNLAAFVCGRFLNAIIMGIAMATAPLYLSEIVPPAYRGAAVTTTNIFNLVSGVVATVIANATHARTGSSSYRIPLAVQCCIPVVLVPLTLIIPESPQWLVAHGRWDEARRNLLKLRAFGDIEEELRLMHLVEDHERKSDVQFSDLFSRKNIRRTITAGVLYSANQVSGIILSTTYATIFLTQLGVADPFGLTIAASCSVLAGTVVAPFLIDRVGRRPLALASMSALFFIDLVCGALAFYTDRRSYALTIAILSFIFNFFWAAGFYSLSLTVPAEIATPKLRSLTVSYTVGWSYVTAVITTLAVPQITAADAGNLGSKAYLIFAGCVACVIVFVYFCLPETARRTFAEIDELYDRGVPARRWRHAQTSPEAQISSGVSVSG